MRWTLWLHRIRSSLCVFSSLATPSDRLPDNQSRSGFDLCGIYIDIGAHLTDKHVNGSTVMSVRGAFRS
jgi:hypothetical protein